MLTILRSVQVKIVMTEASRAALLDQYSQQIEQLMAEREQWQFQAKKILADAKKKSADTYALAQEKLAREDRLRTEKIDNLQFLHEQAQKLPEGSEIDNGTVQSPVNVQVGDVWDDIMTGTQILLKDGRVHAIRQGNGQDPG